MTSVSPPAGVLEVALLRGAIEEMPLGVAIVRGGVVQHANTALEHVFGADPGELEGRRFDELFGPTVASDIRATLDAQRVFDRRVETNGLDGRRVVAEVRAERYRSAGGQGGFVLVRDVSLEAGALGRLVRALGGASFRVRVEGGVLEHVSGDLDALLGVEASTCIGDPSALESLVSPAERERLAGLWRRLADGLDVSATTEVTARRPNGRSATLVVHATGRRDASGLVRHIDGVITARAERPSEGTGVDELRARLVLAGSVLRETSYLHQLGTTTARRIASLARGGAAPEEIAAAADDAVRCMAAEAALSRRVRRALEARAKEAPLIDVLENVRATLATLLGEHAIVVDAGGGSGRFVLHLEHDVMALALTYLGLRAFRLAGSGVLRLCSKREGREIIVDVIGEPGATLDMAPPEPDSGSLPQVPNPGDVVAAFAATELVFARMGAIVEDEGIGVGVARARIRFSL